MRQVTSSTLLKRGLGWHTLEQLRRDGGKNSAKGHLWVTGTICVGFCIRKIETVCVRRAAPARFQDPQLHFGLPKAAVPNFVPHLDQE